MEGLEGREALETAIAQALPAALRRPPFAKCANFIGRELLARRNSGFESGQCHAASLPWDTDCLSAADISRLEMALSAAMTTAFVTRPQSPIRVAAEALIESSTIDAAKAEAHRYFDYEGLLESVESGAIAPLSGRWLVELQRSGGRLRRRQELPPEAFISAKRLRALTVQLGTSCGVLFVALSYRWLTPSHPDPEGFHLATVAAVAAKYLEAGRLANRHPSPLTQALEAAQENGGCSATEADFALFWDFGSLHQLPRSGEEAELFRAGLRASNAWCGLRVRHAGAPQTHARVDALACTRARTRSKCRRRRSGSASRASVRRYGHRESTVWLATALPAGFSGVSYEDSGWCFVESSMSSVITVGARRLDLGRLSSAEGQRALSSAYGGDSFRDEYRLDAVCAAQRPPPLPPSTVETKLRLEKVFTNSADVDAVAALYRGLFDAVAATVDHLDFSRLGWGATEMHALVATLYHFRSLTSLELSHNHQLGDEGHCALSTALRQPARMPPHLALLSIDGHPLPLRHLRGVDPDPSLDLSSRQLRNGSATLIAALLDSNTTLTSLDLRVNAINGVAAVRLATAVLRCNSLAFFGEVCAALALRAPPSRSVNVHTASPSRP